MAPPWRLAALAAFGLAKGLASDLSRFRQFSSEPRVDQGSDGFTSTSLTVSWDTTADRRAPRILGRVTQQNSSAGTQACTFSVAEYLALIVSALCFEGLLTPLFGTPQYNARASDIILRIFVVLLKSLVSKCCYNRSHSAVGHNLTLWCAVAAAANRAVPHMVSLIAFLLFICLPNLVVPL